MAVGPRRVGCMGRLFGTDGVRGFANAELTAELALALAGPPPRRAGAAGFAAHSRVAVVGRDPRASGEMLEAAVVAGLTARASTCCASGVLPTPAVAYLTDAYDADFGVMISASHNPMPDNGIKIFGGRRPQARRRGRGPRSKNSSPPDPRRRPTGAGIGRVVDAEDAVERYLRHVGKAATTRARRADGRRRLCQRRGVGRRAARLPGRRRQRRSPSTPNPTASTSTRTAARRTSRGCRPPSSRTARIWGWPTTAMPTAAWRSTPPVRSSTATRSWSCWRWRCSDAGELATTRWSRP